MPALNQEQYRPQMHAALAEVSALVFDAPGFREASFRFRDPIGPDENAELSIRPVEVGGEPLWQIVRAGLSENKGHGRAKKLLWDLANSANILLEAHASSADGAALHLRTTKKGHVLLQRVRAKGNAECRMMNAECNGSSPIQHSAFSSPRTNRLPTTGRRTTPSRGSTPRSSCSRSASRPPTAR